MKPEQLLEQLDKRWRSAPTIDDHALWSLNVSTQDLRDLVKWVKETQSLLFRAAQLYEESYDIECECGKGDSCKHCAKIGHARSLIYKAVQKYPYLADEGEAHTPNIELLQELKESNVKLDSSKQTPSEQIAGPPIRLKLRRWFQRLFPPRSE